MSNFEDIHNSISEEIVLRIRSFLEWIDYIDPNKAIELNDLFYNLEEEVYTRCISIPTDEMTGQCDDR
jgi:hypothetical protein